MVDHPRRVAGHHADRHPERALRFVAPAGFEYPVGIVSAETLCVGTVRTVDRDAGTYGDEAEDFVAVDRIAAFGQFVVELSYLFVDDECVAAALCRNFFGFASFFGLDGCCCGPALFLRFARQMGLKQLLDLHEVDLFGADRGVKFRSRAEFEVLAEDADPFIDGQGQFPVLEFALQLFPSQTGVLGVFLAQRGLDPGAGLRRGDEPQPVGFGLLILLRQHFDDVSVVEYVADRRRTVIDLAA